MSFQSVVIDWLERHSVKHVGLLGAAAVTDLGDWSAYRTIADHVDVETPADASGLHALIYDVKRYGSSDPSLRPRLQEMIEAMEADTILLACTELPLIADIVTSKTLVDVTDLVAEVLVTRSLDQSAVSYMQSQRKAIA